MSRCTRCFTVLSSGTRLIQIVCWGVGPVSRPSPASSGSQVRSSTEAQNRPRSAGSFASRFKDLCIDANDPALLGRFWASVLDRTWEPDEAGEGRLTGPTPQHTIWINRVPELKTVKHRVHLDIYGTEPAEGSRVVLPEGDDRH